VRDAPRDACQPGGGGSGGRRGDRRPVRDGVRTWTARMPIVDRGIDPRRLGADGGRTGTF
jgi:hypothetical protein